MPIDRRRALPLLAAPLLAASISPRIERRNLHRGSPQRLKMFRLFFRTSS